MTKMITIQALLILLLLPVGEGTYLRVITSITNFFLPFYDKCRICRDGQQLEHPSFQFTMEGNTMDCITAFNGAKAGLLNEEYCKKAQKSCSCRREFSNMLTLWPEVKGLLLDEARNIIQTDYPQSDIQVFYQTDYDDPVVLSADMIENRVRLIVAKDTDQVLEVPFCKCT